MANDDAGFLEGSYLQPQNLFTMYVDQLGNGKSPAIGTTRSEMEPYQKNPCFDSNAFKFQNEFRNGHLNVLQDFIY